MDQLPASRGSPPVLRVLFTVVRGLSRTVVDSYSDVARFSDAQLEKAVRGYEESGSPPCTPPHTLSEMKHQMAERKARDATESKAVQHAHALEGRLHDMQAVRLTLSPQP